MCLRLWLQKNFSHSTHSTTLTLTSMQRSPIESLDLKLSKHNNWAQLRNNIYMFTIVFEFEFLWFLPLANKVVERKCFQSCLSTGGFHMTILGSWTSPFAVAPTPSFSTHPQATAPRHVQNCKVFSFLIDQWENLYCFFRPFSSD